MCDRRLCAELHAAACAGVSDLPTGPAQRAGDAVPSAMFVPRRIPRRERDEHAERVVAEHLVGLIARHRQIGRAALLLANDLDTAYSELQAARSLERDLDRLGAAARECLPRNWELETDLVPLARALSARQHGRAEDAWRSLLDDRPARSIQAEAADWLARHAFDNGQPRVSLRYQHAAAQLGRTTSAEAFRATYRQAGIAPDAAFSIYLAASRLDLHTARAVGLNDPLTDRQWADQDARWWASPREQTPASEPGNHQSESLARARDLAHDRRSEGWLSLAQGDFTAGPLGVRGLGRHVRAGRAEPADEDQFVRIRLSFERAADCLPDSAWPWYRLAELLAWAGFAERATECLAEGERRTLGDRHAERTLRPMLRALVEAGLGRAPNGLATAARPFPSEPFPAPSTWRFLSLRHTLKLPF
jgi:hypothetical protein